MTCGCIRVDEGQLEPLEGLMRFVSPVIPEIPYEVGLEYLRQAFIDFGKKSRLLVSHQTLVLQRDVREYELEPPEGYMIYGIMQRCPRTYGYILLPNAHRWFAYYGERLRIEGNNRLILEQAPSVDGKQFELALHLIPTDCTDDIPEEINTPFGRGIAKGAIGELLDMPNKPWSNPRAADKYKREFAVVCMEGRNLHLTNRGAHKVMMDYVRVL